MRRDFQTLTAPGFLAGLALLFANDFLFKPLFHDGLTGKLSDFAGLFVFPVFWAALAPRRRRAVFAATALGFAFWKSPSSQPLVDWWNALPLFKVGRVVDPTDLFALLALPPAYFYSTRRAARQTDAPPAAHLARRRCATCLIALLSVFAFAATSFRTKFDYDNQEFTFADSRDGLVSRFKRLPHEIYRGNYWSGNPAPDEYTIRLKAGDCFEQIHALVELKEQDPHRTRLVLRKLEHECPEEKGDREKMLTTFLHEVVEKLQDDIDAHPSGDGEPTPPPAGRRSASPPLRQKT